MQKNVLKLTGTREIFFEDTALIGIVSALPGHNLCWLINHHFDIDFVREMDAIEQIKKDTVSYFPHYLYLLPDCNSLYRFYHLKNGGEQLLPELKQFDFTWLVKSTSCAGDVIKITNRLRTIPEITVAHILPFEQIRNINNLLV